MRIEHIEISRYGPLENLSHAIDSSFQCIYGPNESGKTLLIDALLKMTLGRKLRKPLKSSLNRVDEEPKGWIDLQVDGTKVRVDHATSLSEATGIPPEELRDIFVIRNSDMALLEEDRCLDRVADRILGLSSDSIDLIVKELLSNGKLISSLKLSGIGGKKSPASQVKAAKKLIDEIEGYLASINEDELAASERNLVELSTRLGNLKQARDELELARRYKEFLELKSAVEKAQAIIEKQGRLPDGFQQEIIQALAEFKESCSHITYHKRRTEQFGRLMIVCGIGLGISAVIAIMNSGLAIGLVQSVIILAAILFSARFWLQSNSELHKSEKLTSQLMEMSLSLGNKSHDTHEAVDFLNERISLSKSAAEDLIGTLAIIKKELKLKKSAEAAIIEQAQAEVDRRRSRFVKPIDAEYSDENLDDVVGEIERVKEETDTHRGKIDNHLRKLQYFETVSRNVDFESVPVGVSSKSLDSVESLKHFTEDLNRFISYVEEHAETCRLAISIFRQLGVEEQRSVSELLSKGSRAAELFNEITGGRYTDVTYDPEKRQILVTQLSGTQLDTVPLSKGTRDQLYLAVRVALGEKLLMGQTGFFIMDDPFLTSDEHRVERQIEVMKQLVQLGWQIVFLTARKNLAEKTVSAFDTDYIELKALPLS